jgi:hypothetical protein
MPEHRPGPTPPYAGQAGVAADRDLSGDGQPGTPSPAPSGGWPPPGSPDPVWRAASAPVAADPPSGLPETLIASGLASLTIAGAGLLVVTRLRRQW